MHNLKLPKTIPVINPLLLRDILFRIDKRTALFLELPVSKRIELLRALTPKVRQDILLRIPEHDVAGIMQAVDPDEATDMLQILTKHRRERVLRLLSQEMQDSLSTLLEFDAQTAAGLMTLDYIQVQKNETMADVAKRFKRHEKSTGRPPVVLVMDDHKLNGFLPGYQLGLAEKHDEVSRFMKRVASISFAATHKEVLRMFQSHPHDKVVVLNDAGNILGIIYSDDVLKLMHEREASSLYDFAGISPEETVTDTTQKKVQHRYKWLIINLGTAFLAAFAVGLFEDTLNKYVLLAIYMPIVAGMGGNAATQTLAVIVRGIALRQIQLSTALRTLKNELGAGLINGLINGVLVALVVIAVNGDYQIAIILGFAMVINLLVAAFFGTLVPLIMSKLGKDPAASATIFITTATDVLGFIVFLGLASLILA